MSSLMLPAMTNPEMTKKISTPVKPPGVQTGAK